LILKVNSAVFFVENFLAVYTNALIF